MIIPQYIFIIPYRNRKEHIFFFKKYTSYLLEDYEKDSYRLLFVNQHDNLPFNRGAMKNMGFKYIKKIYPDSYKSIILIFNDVDTLPHKKGLLNYNVNFGEIKHFYGYTFALGGIFSIRAGDFEKINGFPNYWNWGFEDNILNNRALNHNLKINRNQFYKIQSMEILHFLDEYQKLMDENIVDKLSNSNYIEKDGLNYLSNYKYEFNIQENMLYIHSFNSLYSHKDIIPYYHNIKNGGKVMNKKKKQMIFT